MQNKIVKLETLDRTFKEPIDLSCLADVGEVKSKDLREGIVIWIKIETGATVPALLVEPAVIAGAAGLLSGVEEFFSNEENCEKAKEAHDSLIRVLGSFPGFS
jgi:hypothetical protein